MLCAIRSKCLQEFEDFLGAKTPHNSIMKFLISFELIQDLRKD
jgi:hypothetical protein